MKKRDPANSYRRAIYLMWIGVLAVFAIFLRQFGTSPPTWILLAVIIVAAPFSIRAQRRSLARLRAQSDH